MKYFSGFFAGMLVGVAVGFLFAPSSGEELRAQIQQEAQKEFEKLEAEWHRRLEQVQQAIEETQGDVEEMKEKSEAEQAA